MKNLKLSILVISTLIGGMVGCQKNQPSPFNIQTSSSGKIVSNNAKVSDALTQLHDDDVIDIEVVTVGYKESPATESKINLKVYLSASSSSDLGSKPLPPQVAVKRDFTSPVLAYPVTGTRGAKFQVLLKWKKIQFALGKINSDATKPIYFSWKFTPAGGSSSDLYSINLGDRISRDLNNSSKDVISDSINQTRKQIALFTESRDTSSQANALATAQVMQSLLLTDGLSKIYPLVDNIESANINSFSYVGLSVTVERSH
jgi:hypothetical protein